MTTSISSVNVDGNDEEPSILRTSLAALVLSSISEENSSHTSKDFNSNHLERSILRPHVDPSLVIKRRRNGEETWLKDFKSPSSAPKGAYSPIAQAVKKLLPERTACRLGCSGANCKYERADFWRPEQMAINGIFSHWITDNILACSRPTTRHKDLTRLFHDAGIRAIFNLELPDEHVSCGHGNHQSGFSYNPSEFMDAGIFVYNFAMEDYGTVKVETLLDIMKVMTFALKQGKVAVHCHAGLGRTGFVICSYLVHEYRMTAHEAIHYMRGKRPNSVQMTKQIEAVEEYERFIIPKRRVFTDCADFTDSLPLEVNVKNQQAFLHGRDEKIFKYIPRVVFVCAARLVGLCTGYMMDTILITLNRRRNAKPVFVRENLQSFTEEEKTTWLDFAPSFFYEREHSSHRDFSPYKQIIRCLISSINESFLTSEQQTKISEWKRKINKTNDGVDEIFEETDPCVISGLMWSWLKLLKEPVIRKDDFHHFSKDDVKEQSLTILSELNQYQRGVIELLAKMFAFIRRFSVQHDDELLIYCILNILTHRPLSETDQVKRLTVDQRELHSFLVSEKSNYLDKSQSTTIEHLVSHQSLTRELMTNLKEFFLVLTSQFDQH